MRYPYVFLKQPDQITAEPRLHLAQGIAHELLHDWNGAIADYRRCVDAQNRNLWLEAPEREYVIGRLGVLASAPTGP
jgi:hypothetical protein